MTRAGRVVLSLLIAIAGACNTGALQPDAGNTSAPPDGGNPSGYSGCYSGGAYSRIFISKCDAVRGLNFVVMLENPASRDVPAMPGLTEPADWRLRLARGGDDMGGCPSQAFGPFRAAVTGTVEWSHMDGNFPRAVNIDVILRFEPRDAAVLASEPMTARNVDASAWCEMFISPVDD
jgi:hypothetical protein